MIFRERVEQLSDLISTVETQAFEIIESNSNFDSNLRANILFGIYNSLVDLKNSYQSLEIGNNYSIRERNDAIKARNLKCDYSSDSIPTRFFNETIPALFKNINNLNMASIESFYKKYLDIFKYEITFQSSIIEPIEEYESGEEYENLLGLIAVSKIPPMVIFFINKSEH